MVALPTVPLRLFTSEAPKPGVSAGDIAAPYAELASTFQHVSAAAEDIAKPAAAQAGRQAVSRDADGNLNITSLPIIGPASAEFERNAQMEYLGKMEPEIATKMTQLRLAHPNDPQGFQTAADSYVKAIKAPNPTLTSIVGGIAARDAGQHYRGMLEQADHLNVQNGLSTLMDRITATSDRMAAIARQGGTDTPEYAASYRDLKAITDTLVADPRNGFTRERADLLLKAHRDEDMGQAIVGQTERIFQSKRNVAQAQKYLQDTLWGPGSEKLNLTPAQRDHYVSEGLRSLERIGTEERAEVKEFRGAITTYQNRLIHAPDSMNEVEHSGMIAKAKAINDPVSLAHLDLIKDFQPMWQAFHGMAPAEQAQFLATMNHGLMPALPANLPGGTAAVIEKWAQQYGVPVAVAKRIAAIESGGNPNAVTPSGTYKGLFQLGPQEWAKYGSGGNILNPDDNARVGLSLLADKQSQFQLKFGRMPSDNELYLAHQQGMAGLAAHLGNPDAPAWQNMAATAEGQRKGTAWAKQAIWGNVPPDMKALFPGGVDSMTSRDFMNVWAQKIQGIPMGSGMAAGQPAALGSGAAYKLFETTANALRTSAGSSAEHLATQIKAAAKDYGATIDPETVKTFAQMASASGKEALIPDVMKELTVHDAEQKYQPGQGNTAVLEGELAKLRAAGGDPTKISALNELRDRFAKQEDGLKNDPYTTAVSKKWTAPVGKIDVSNPQAAAAEMATRQQRAGVIAQHAPSLGPIPAFEQREGEAIKTALTQGDPGQAKQFLETAATSLSPENYKVTMYSKPMRDALDGMISSYDPVRLNAGMATLDRLQSADPISFEKTFGEESLKRLHVWQSWKDTGTPAEIAERFKRADDPSFAAARKTLGEKADEENKKITPANVASALYASDHPVLSWLPFTGASAPSDIGGAQGEAMKAEFDTFRKDLRSYGVDADKATQKAAEKLKTIYGASPLNGNELMRRPPERYYPMVNGSYDWMKGPIEDDIAKAVGKPRLGYVHSDIGPHVTTNWDYHIVADRDTEADIGAGRPPSYQVFIQDASTGEWNAPRGADGRLMRYRWDANAAQQQARDKFNRRRTAEAAGRLLAHPEPAQPTPAASGDEE